MPVGATNRSLGGLSGDPLGVVKKEITHFEECLGEHPYGWPFCVTTRGHISWVPATANTNDEIWIAKVASVPLVLRAHNQYEATEG